MATKKQLMALKKAVKKNKRMGKMARDKAIRKLNKKLRSRK